MSLTMYAIVVSIAVLALTGRDVYRRMQRARLTLAGFTQRARR